MVITYHGENYVKVSAGPLTFLVDPLDERSFRGAKFVCMTEDPSPLLKRNVREALALREPFLVLHPGEYEVEGVRIEGYPATVGEGRTRIAYRVVLEDLILGFLGALTAFPEERVLERLAGCDVLFLPGGGKPHLRESDAAKLVRQLEPGIVIPTLLSSKRTCESFVKELGAKPAAPSEKLVLRKKDIVPKAMAVVCLTHGS